MSSTPASSPCEPALGWRETWGSPATYFIAFVFIALCLGPVIYIILGGFRDNSQITNSPKGFPNPWNFDNYAEVLASPTFAPSCDR